MALSRDQILAADDLPRTEVPVKEWGGSVFIRHLTLEEVLTLREEGKEALAARILVMTAVDDKGVALFKDGDAPSLQKKNAKAMQSLLQAVLDINGLGKDPVEKAAKN